MGGGGFYARYLVLADGFHKRVYAFMLFFFFLESLARVGKGGRGREGGLFLRKQ